MKRGITILIFIIITTIGSGQIVADHTVVDLYDDIPAYWINEVKKMLVWFPGESHSAAYRDGLELLEAIDATYNVTVDWGYPPVSTTALRSAAWPMDLVGEARWFTWKAYTENIPSEKDVIKDLISGQVTASNPIHLVGFAWCWDMVYGSPTATADPTLGVHWYGESDNGPDGNKAWGIDTDDYAQTENGVSLQTYFAATEDYIAYCASNSPLTNVAFTTGPVDHYAATGEGGYQVYLKHQAIRNYVTANGKILFDYADILCYDDGSETPNTTTWDGHTYPIITSTNGATEDVGHITNAGAVRLAKAQWWLLARIAGWDGRRETVWEGNSGTSWDDPSNWSDGIPDGNTNVIIPDVTPYPVIGPGVTAGCYNLTIETGAMLTINSETGNSGSLIVSGQAYGSVTYNCLMPDDALYHYVASPLSTPDLPAEDTFWAWDEVSGDWGDPVTECVSGAGYTVRANGTTITFTGSIVNVAGPVVATSPYLDCDFMGGAEDDYSLRPFAPGRDNDINYGGGGWNLLGNPFTSAMSAASFISYNEASFDQNYKALYIYDGVTYSYIGSELTGWENADGISGSSNVQAGQGFFVAARCNSSLFSFTSGMQTHNTSATLTKSASAAVPWPGLQLEARSAAGEASALVVYTEGMTNDLDPGYDVGQMSTSHGINIYTTLAATDNGIRFARQALPVAGAGAIAVPVGIDFADGGEVVFSAHTVPLADNKFWLEDRTAGIYTDLGTGSYTVSLPANTYGTGRFFIIASAHSPSGTEQIPAEETGIRVWSSNHKIVISGGVTGAAICEVYNLLGQKILESRLTDGAMNTVNLPYRIQGVVFIRITDLPLITFTRKIVIL